MWRRGGGAQQPMVLETCVRLMLKRETSIVTTDAHSFYKQHKELLPPGVHLDASQKMEFEVVLQGESGGGCAIGVEFRVACRCACARACARGWPAHLSSETVLGTHQHETLVLTAAGATTVKPPPRTGD